MVFYLVVMLVGATLLGYGYGLLTPESLQRSNSYGIEEEEVR
jgi:hypothetical protein